MDRIRYIISSSGHRRGSTAVLQNGVARLPYGRLARMREMVLSVVNGDHPASAADPDGP